MKKYIYIVLLIICSFANGQQNKYQKIYYDFEDTKGVTTISINKAMFNMLGNLQLDEDLKNMESLFKKMNSIKMIIATDKQNEIVRTSIKNAFRNLNLEELMAINNEGNKVKFYAEDSNSKVFKNLILNIISDETLMYMILDGEISADDLNTLIK